MEIKDFSYKGLTLYKILPILVIISAGIYSIFKKGYTAKQKIIVSITTIISLFVGARLFYILVNYKKVTMSTIFSLKFTNFKLYGAVTFAIMNIIVFSKIYNVKLTKPLEPTLMWIYIGGIFSKIGCFFSGCCKGKPTHLPWGVYKSYDVTKSHPASLYDSGAFLLSLITLLVLRKTKVKDSSRISISLLVYVILRGLIEDTYYNGVLFGSAIAKCAYFLTIIICVGIILKNIIQKNLNKNRKFEKTLRILNKKVYSEKQKRKIRDNTF